MTREEIEQKLIDNGKDPNDYNIEINNQGYSIVAKWYCENKEIAKELDKPIKDDVDIVAETTAITMMDMETLAETVVYLMEKVAELEGRLNG